MISNFDIFPMEEKDRQIDFMEKRESFQKLSWSIDQKLVYDRNGKNWFRPNTEYSAISTEYSAEHSAEYLPYCQT